MSLSTSHALFESEAFNYHEFSWILALPMSSQTQNENHLNIVDVNRIQVSESHKRPRHITFDNIESINVEPIVDHNAAIDNGVSSSAVDNECDNNDGQIVYDIDCDLLDELLLKKKYLTLQ